MRNPIALIGAALWLAGAHAAFAANAVEITDGTNKLLINSDGSLSTRGGGTAANNADAVSAAASGLDPVAAYGFVYNGTTWDRARGDTTNGAWVNVKAMIALPAGTALIGKVGFDQTTPGTTNAVAPIAGQNGVVGGTGTRGATTQRITLATDDEIVGYLNTLQSIVSASRAAVNPISGQSGVQGGAGASTALTQRVALATDANSVTQLPTAGALTSSSITVTNASGAFLAASTASKFLMCKNESTSASIALNFANGTAVLNTAGNITLPPGASINFDGTAVPTGAITGISSAASSPATCLSS